MVTPTDTMNRIPRRRDGTSRTTLSPLWSLVVAVAFAGIREADALPPELLQVVSSDVAVAWFVDAGQGRAPERGSSLGMATFLVDQAGSLGLLSTVDAECRGWIEALAGLGVLLDYPHAAAVFDVQTSKLADGGHRLSGLHGALILRAGSQVGPIEHRIQRLLNRYTNSAESVLAASTVGERKRFTLRDSRMPDWWVLTWGAVGQWYVVAVGDWSFDRVVDVIDSGASSLMGDPWCARAFGAARGSEAMVAVHLRFDRIRETGDESLRRKIVDVREALGLDQVDRGLWTLQRQDRAMVVRGATRVGSEDWSRTLTVEELVGVGAAELVPAQARGYALLDVEPERAASGVAESWLASQSPGNAEQLRRYWQVVQNESGVDVRSEILSRLGRGLLIHDAPPHPLPLPLMWTVAAPIASEPDELRRAVDKLCTVWQRQLEEEGSVRLRHTDEGVWYLFIGIQGPAIGLSHHWVVLSYSPEAVRQNLAALETMRNTPKEVRTERNAP